MNNFNKNYKDFDISCEFEEDTSAFKCSLKGNISRWITLEKVVKEFGYSHGPWDDQAREIYFEIMGQYYLHLKNKDLDLQKDLYCGSLLIDLYWLEKIFKDIAQ